MADEEENTNGIVNTMEDKTEDVFLNGDNNVCLNACEEEDEEEDDDEENGVCNSDINLPDQVIPRRSSLMNKDGKKRSNRKKTVSFSSMPTEKKIATAQDCLAYMQNGSELIKVRSNSRQYHRFFSLSNDVTEIRWQPTSKKPHKARIAVSSIKEVRQGKTTEALRSKEIVGIYPDECAFSIIFGEEFESMDLIANTPDEANIWISGLTCLLNANTRSSDCK
ncbi:unnamed protein product [Lymnaea stagnalis]|uniref:PH domain-containing protein n=1 Tax=Lymnaea stagnalis TaxID=6523 RepID=A0AAV2IM37_LYMST